MILINCIQTVEGAQLLLKKPVAMNVSIAKIYSLKQPTQERHELINGHTLLKVAFGAQHVASIYARRVIVMISGMDEAKNLIEKNYFYL